MLAAEEALRFDRNHGGASITNLCFSSAQRYKGKSRDITLLWPRIRATLALLAVDNEVSSICKREVNNLVTVSMCCNKAKWRQQ